MRLFIVTTPNKRSIDQGAMALPRPYSAACTRGQDNLLYAQSYTVSLGFHHAPENCTIIACQICPFEHIIMLCKGHWQQILLVVPCADDFRRRVYDANNNNNKN